MKLRDYKFTFNISALILFLLIMLPNIVWFIVPAPNDVLRGQSATPVLDILATITQVLMLTALFIFKNSKTSKLKLSPFIIISAAFCVLYHIAWVLYYCNIVNGVIVICLCLLPCLSFIFYGVDRKNYFALIPTALFAALHFTSTVINFL